MFKTVLVSTVVGLALLIGGCASNGATAKSDDCKMDCCKDKAAGHGTSGSAPTTQHVH